MKRVRIERIASQLQPPLRLSLQSCPFTSQTTAPRKELQRRQYHIQRQWQGQKHTVIGKRRASNVVAAEQPESIDDSASATLFEDDVSVRPRPPLYAPSYKKSLHSAKLAALHSRLSLPSKLPLPTLARCLIDPSADPRPGYNNAPFSVLGQDLLGYHTTEYLTCHYPRLPMSVLFAAQYAYVGSAALANVRSEWGVEVVAAPGQEVDPGLLQLKREVPGNSLAEGTDRRMKDMPGVRKLGGILGTGRANAEWNYRRGMSGRVVHDDEFGDLQSGMPSPDSQPYPGSALAESAALGGETTEDGFSQLTPADTDATTVESASASFVRAVTGALYLHAGASAAKGFHRDHILSRHLQLEKMFNFTHPTRDLSRLCARENFEPPVARLISETGRLSRTPVFVVGVYSGENLLGEAAGASLNEARVRAAGQALRSWYLYSPPVNDVVLPSDVEEGKGGKVWKAQMIDVGEIVT
ncbi:hypothetical protein LTR62_004402 [Meristemomyces frigidus]|uniref:Large ribosomal subunit protein mL44 n=1 Tax=Meristemomyces frigidus TaxID=1508187 RepID=A0AAN7TFJ4_9PEZI|nr:hypothetical protein LTR62_004402 [Meristemomyces frigidus]